MKKKFTARIGVVALMLTLVSICLLGGTMARYTSTVTGTGKANIAAWKIAFSAGKTGTESQTANFNFTLADTKVTNGNVKTDAIAPGDKGEIKIKIDGTGSEVAYEYKIELVTSAFTQTSGNVKFYSDKECKTEWKSSDEAFVPVALGSVNTAEEKSIYWQWENNDANNTDDTAAGKTAAGVDAADLEFTVTLTAQQTIAAPTT